nr:immunoglobulin heavy chain junction region [Macaca mulatta]
CASRYYSGPHYYDYW